MTQRGRVRSVGDLRHTGNMLAAESASLQELMARMGHSSTRLRLPRLEPGDLSDVDTSGLRQLGLRQPERGRPCSSC